MAQSTEITASDIDQLVGDRIRQRRILLGFTQDQLGEALGISYQQIQKYETGANRISAGRLYQIAETLQVPVGWFFDSATLAGDALKAENVGGSTRHVIELVRGFSRIGEDRLRMAVLSLVRALGDQPGEVADLVSQAGLVASSSNGNASTANGASNSNGGARPEN